MSKKRDTHTYALFQGRKKVYIGYTSDLARREAEHEREGKQFSRSEKTSPLMTEAGAQQREERLLEAYSGRHSGRTPKYNKTKR